MAMHVVDRLEMVEVEHQHRHRLVAALGAHEHGGAFLGQAAAIEEAGQRILRCQLLRALLGGGADRHFDAQFTVPAPAEQDQRDIEQQRDDQGLIAACPAGEILPERGRQHSAPGADEQQDRGNRDRAAQQLTFGRDRLLDDVFVCIQRHAGCPTILLMPLMSWIECRRR